MPRKKAPTAAGIARDKARKQVQNLFDQFKDPLERTSDGRYLLKLDGPPFFDEDDLIRLQVKLLSFDVDDATISNSEPSFFKPWSDSELEDHPVDIDAVEEDGLEDLEIGAPIHGPSNSLASARQIRVFINGQYFHVPRANFGRGSFETLSHHSKWCRVL